MLKWQIRQTVSAYELTIELSYELDDPGDLQTVIAKYGQELLRELSEAVHDHAVEQQIAKRRRAKYDAKAKQTQQEFYELGCKVEKRVKALIAGFKAQGSNLPYSELKKKALKLVAKEECRPAPELKLYAKYYRRRFKAEKSSALNVRLLKLVRDGLTHKEIARKTGLHPKSVSRKLSELHKRLPTSKEATE